jgi:hypothetical protein
LELFGQEDRGIPGCATSASPRARRSGGFDPLTRDTR